MKKIEVRTYNRIVGIFKFIIAFFVAVLWLSLYFFVPFFKAYVLSNSGKKTIATIEESNYRYNRGRRGITTETFTYKITYDNYKGSIEFPNDIGDLQTLKLIYSTENPTILTYSDESDSFGQYFLRLSGHGIGALILIFLFSTLFIVYALLNLINRGIKGNDDSI